jgi:hypothetical protein
MYGVDNINILKFLLLPLVFGLSRMFIDPGYELM